MLDRNRYNSVITSREAPNVVEYQQKGYLILKSVQAMFRTDHRGQRLNRQPECQWRTTNAFPITK